MKILNSTGGLLKGNSILKSQYLTNKRESKYKAEFEDKTRRYPTTKESGNLRKIKTDGEGRLPIRRPSVVDPMLAKHKASPFTTHKNSLMAGKSKEENTKEGKEEKTELDYINHDKHKDREDLNSFLSRSLFTNKFQLVWAAVLFLAHTYNVLALFYYLGISDFPQGGLLALQLFFEAVLLIDFVLRLCIKTFSSEVWESLWLLHDYFAFSTKTGLAITAFASFPAIFIVALSTSKMSVLNSFSIALLRIPKVLRFREVGKMLSTYTRADKEKSKGYIHSFEAAYALLLATHIIGCIWLIVGRVDPTKQNWHDMDNFDENPSHFEIYIEACFFTVATMTGLGYGNVVPTTDLEVFVDMFIMVTGASIYANFFANFIVTMNNRNAKRIEKHKKHDQAKNFGSQLNIAEPIMLKIRYFYNELSLKYGDLYDRYANLKDLPTSLSTELSIFLNSNLIKRIKLFQFSNPMFILSVTRAMMPKLCMANDYVVERGDIAEEIFFIKKGVVEVLATDNSTVIAYLSEGSYFGEIGVLLTGVRSCTVKAKTVCIFFVIKKDEFLSILDRYPEQKAFLKAVGRQRLQTTNPEDLIDEEEEDEMKNLLENQSLLNEIEGKEQLFGDEGKLPKIKTIANLSQQIKTYRKRKNKKLPWNVTKQYPILDKFLIIPLSKLYYIWTLVMVFTLAYTLFIVPFAISFEYEFSVWLIPFDLLSLIVFAVDIFMTSRTAFNKNFEITIEIKNIVVDYMDTRFFFDLLAVIPVDYFCLIFGVDQQITAFCRLLRLLKFYKPFDYIKTWRKHSNVKLALFTLALLSVLFVVISHLMGCIYFFIGRHEVGDCRRYDCQTLFENTIDRDFLTLQEVLKMSIIQQYVHFVYLSACTMGAVMYGDMIPLAMSEQLFTFCAMFTARIYLAFLYAEAAAYLSSVHSAYSNHVRVRSTIVKYLELHNLPYDMKKRVYKYHEVLWNNFKGINMNEILSDLPESIQKQIKFSLFSDLIRSVTLFPKDDKAAISALISRLELQLISEGEYVIRDGEIADCMYFILRGSVNVIKNGVVLATLEQGSHFGEMALAARKPTIRTASALCITQVSVGTLSITNFNIICASYPIFESKIEEAVIKRKEDLEMKTKNVEETKSLQKQKSKDVKIITKKADSRSSGKRKSIKTSNKGSRQDKYQIDEEEDDLGIGKFRKNIFEQHVYPEKKVSIQSSSDPNKYYIDGNINVDVNKDIEESDDKVNDSKAIILVPENPNMPDSALVPSAEIEGRQVDNIINCEESEDYSVKSSDDKKQPHKSQTQSNSSGQLQEGEAEIKSSKNKYAKVLKLIKHVTPINVFSAVLLLFVLYNIVFIPLQAAYRIDYGPGFIIMEVFTLLLYFADIILTFKAHKEIKNRLRDLHRQEPNTEKHLWRSIDDEKKDLKKVRFYIVLCIISLIPFSLFFWIIDVDEPLLLIYYLKMLRLTKVLPVYKFFNWFKQRALNITRIVEMLFVYYCACHIIACSFICIAYTQPDIRDTWLRRLPVPQPSGIRKYPDFTGLSDRSIYVHALNFTVNTVSHVAIGEITTVTYEERIYNAFVILCGTFIYAFLFGNVASIMADFAPQMFFFRFHKQFEDVMSSLNKDAVPKGLIAEIKDYFDYVWANSKGISYTEFLGGLPPCLNADILYARYAEAINNSIIFRNENDEVNNALTNSILTVLELRIYMDGDFIVIGGSTSKNSYIVLEGEAIVLGLNEELIAYIMSGGHYSNDLDPKDEDTFQYKRPLHIVSKGISIVGVLNVEKLYSLYVAYPEFKENFRRLNKNFIECTERYCKKYLKSKNVVYSPKNLIKYIADHYSYSTSVVYDSVREKCIAIDMQSDEVRGYDITLKQQE